MAHKYYQTKKTAVTLTSSPQKKRTETKNTPLSFSNWVPAIFVLLYVATDFVPQGKALDVMGPQWFYLVIVNCIATLYIYSTFKKNGYDSALQIIIKRTLSILYLGLFVVAGFSILFAINKVEALVNYAFFIATIMAFFNIALLLYGRLEAFKLVAWIISIILFFQAAFSITEFFKSIDTTSLNDVIYNLKGNTGNKNIFAASIIVKIPFVMYCIYTLRSWGKFFNISVLLLGIFAVFLVNARASYVGLIAEIFLFIVYCVLQQLQEKKTINTLYRLASVLLPVIIAFFFGQVTLTNIESAQGTSGGYGSVTSRLSSITTLSQSSNALRLEMWSNGFDYIKKNPLMGCGYANCKIAMVPYEKTMENDFLFGKHTHNDFIEMTMELGIPGGLLFLSLFIWILIYTLKIWKSDANEGTKLIAVISLIALAGYFIDAFFNFPNERPIMQLYFALILAVNISAYNSMKAASEKNTPSTPKYIKQLFFGICIPLIAVSAYLTYNNQRSLVVQGYMYDNFPNQPVAAWVEVKDELPDIPNLSVLGFSFDTKKAWHLYQIGEYEEALKLANKSISVNPYSMQGEYVKTNIFLKTGKLDSAFYYGTKCFFERPRNLGFYNVLLNICVQRKDTATMQKAFKKFTFYRNEPIAWSLYIQYLERLNYDQQVLFDLNNQAKRLFPGDKNFEKPSNYMTVKPILNKAIDAFGKKDYQTALSCFLELSKLNPTDYSFPENAGKCYFSMGRYPEAISSFDQVIKSKAFNNGVAEYYKALSLLNIGKKEEGCTYLKLADTKNFPDAKKMISAHCN